MNKNPLTDPTFGFSDLLKSVFWLPIGVMGWINSFFHELPFVALAVKVLIWGMLTWVQVPLYGILMLVRTLTLKGHRFDSALFLLLPIVAVFCWLARIEVPWGPFYFDVGLNISKFFW